MRTFRTCMVVLFSVATLAVVAGADKKPTAKGGGENADFERIKALSGEWKVTGGGPEEHAAHEGSVTYKVTAGGSAVLETLFGGTAHEMVTLYYLEGKELALTHYCMLRNRPHMRAQRPAGKDKIVFQCREGENAEIDAEDHMHQATFTFVDDDHFTTEWVLYKDGKRDSAHSFELTRIKE